MLKLAYTILTDPLGLPIEPLGEYVILLIIGEIVHEIAWDISPGGPAGSLIYWTTKLLVFVVIWTILYVIITVVNFVVEYWIYFAIVGAVFILLAMGLWAWRKKRKIKTVIYKVFETMKKCC